MEILLASGSEVRRQMLAAAGIRAGLRGHGVDERAVEAPLRTGGAGDRAIASALAEAKALAVSRTEPDAVVIGADQTLELDGRAFTKPADRGAARRQLHALSGRTHRLHSAFAVAWQGRVAARRTSSPRLTMRDLSPAEIDWYLDAAGDAVLGSVGAYQVEGLGIRLFERIEGDYFAVLGLPLLPLIAVLRRLGAVTP